MLCFARRPMTSPLAKHASMELVIGLEDSPISEESNLLERKVFKFGLILLCPKQRMYFGSQAVEK